MIDWHEIDTVLLDMDGTLLDLHYDNYFWTEHLPRRYAITHGVDLGEAHARLSAHIKAHEGTLQWYCLDHWSAALQMDIQSLKREVQEKIQVRPFVIEFLQRLAQNGKRLVLITNAHPQSLELKMEVTHIDKHLDLVISSHEFNYPKEDQAFWLSLKAREHFNPARTLFIDDTVRILDSARDFGIAHLLCIHQPDSQQSRQIDAYPAIHHFDEIMPPVNIQTQV